MTIDFPTIIPKFDAILARGLYQGVGTADGQMCIEAAIALAMGLPFNDEPECVAVSVRWYKISLNDKSWSSPQARAAGLRNLGIAQIGSKGVVDDVEFTKRLAEKTIRVLIPTLFRELFPTKRWALDAADHCEAEGTAASARKARDDAYNAANYAANYANYAVNAANVAANAAANAANAANYASYAATYAAANAANAATYASYAATYAAAAAVNAGDKYLLLSASLALEVLQESKSPGCAWLEFGAK